MSKEAKESKPFYQRTWFIILAIILVSGACTNLGSEEEPAADDPAEPVVVEELAEESTAGDTVVDEEGILHNDYYVLYTKIMYYATQVDDIHTGVLAMEESYGAGEASDLEYYNLLDTSEDTANNLNRLFYDLDVPESFPDEEKELMKDVIDNFSMGAFMRSEAYKSYKKYLDGGALEDANNVQTDLESSGSYFISGNTGLLEIEMAIGVERDEEGEIIR